MNCLQIFDNSQVVFDWFLGIDTLHSLAIKLCQQRIRQLQEIFELEVSHIHKENNIEVDRRSKETLLQTVGHLVITEKVIDVLRVNANNIFLN